MEIKFYLDQISSVSNLESKMALQGQYLRKIDMFTLYVLSNMFSTQTKHRHLGVIASSESL